MAHPIPVGLIVLLVAVSMTMVGKGGGNFYVVILAVAGIPMHEAAATGQFILFFASLAALIVFQKHRSVSWALAISVGSVTAVSALAGGYYSNLFSGFILKLIFVAMLLAAGVVMLIPIKEKAQPGGAKRWGVIPLRSDGEIFWLNLWIALPATILTGFGSGMVGVSGGSFLVPLMVLTCGVPMHRAVGTASTLIAATALLGFTGHAARGDFDPEWAVPLAIVTVAGGLLGGSLALKTKPKHLKRLFAYTNWLAALFMLVNALRTRGII